MATSNDDWVVGLKIQTEQVDAAIKKIDALQKKFANLGNKIPKGSSGDSSKAYYEYLLNRAKEKDAERKAKLAEANKKKIEKETEAAKKKADREAESNKKKADREAESNRKRADAQLKALNSQIKAARKQAEEAKRAADSEREKQANARLTALNRQIREARRVKREELKAEERARRESLQNAEREAHAANARINNARRRGGENAASLQTAMEQGRNIRTSPRNQQRNAAISSELQQRQTNRQAIINRIVARGGAERFPTLAAMYGLPPASPRRTPIQRDEFGRTPKQARREMERDTLTWRREELRALNRRQGISNSQEDLSLNLRGFNDSLQRATLHGRDKRRLEDRATSLRASLSNPTMTRQGLAEARREFRGLQMDLRMMARETGSARHGISRLSRSLSMLSNPISQRFGYSLSHAIGTLGSVYLAGSVSKEVYDNAKKMENMRVATIMAEGGKGAATVANNKVRAMSQEMGLSYEAATDMYNKVIISAKDAGIGAEERDKIYRGIGILQVGYGMGAEQQKLVSKAFAQMFGKQQVMA